MKYYIISFLLGCLTFFLIMGMLWQIELWQNAKILVENQGIRENYRKAVIDLTKANERIDLLTYNFNYNMKKKDDEIERLRGVE